MVFHVATQPVLRTVSHHCAVVVHTKYRAMQATQQTKAQKRSDFDDLKFLSPDVRWEEMDTALSEYDWLQGGGGGGRIQGTGHMVPNWNIRQY